MQTKSKQIADRKMLLRCPAKVNLYLRVGPRRQDGFHTLVSLFCSLGLFDEMVLSPGTSAGISLVCDDPGVPTDQANLVIRAGLLLRPFARRECPVHFEVRKRIPAGGGLGGGSSDAAAALKALARLWECELNDDAMRAIAGRLGSDVPFFLQGPSAICRGRGEIVTPVDRPAARGILLLFPKTAMPTPLVYRKFDELGLGTNLSKIEKLLPRTDLPARQLLDLLVNDLERPAFAISPELEGVRVAAEHLLGRPVRMSGSGSTLFTIYESTVEAEAAAAGCAELGIRRHACELGYLPSEAAAACS